MKNDQDTYNLGLEHGFALAREEFELRLAKIRAAHEADLTMLSEALRELRADHERMKQTHRAEINRLWATAVEQQPARLQ